MKYDIHPANEGECIGERVIDSFFFFPVLLPSSVFKVIFHYWKIESLPIFQRLKDSPFFLLFYVLFCFSFVLICVLNIGDQFSLLLFRFCFSLVFKPCIVISVLLKWEQNAINTEQQCFTSALHLFQKV